VLISLILSRISIFIAFSVPQELYDAGPDGIMQALETLAAEADAWSALPFDRESVSIVAMTKEQIAEQEAKAILLHERLAECMLYKKNAKKPLEAVASVPHQRFKDTSFRQQQQREKKKKRALRGKYPSVSSIQL
jgi:hypothetical protein